MRLAYLLEEKAFSLPCLSHGGPFTKYFGYYSPTLIPNAKFPPYHKYTEEVQTYSFYVVAGENLMWTFWPPIKIYFVCLLGCFEHYHLFLLPPILLPRPAGLHHAAWRFHHCCRLRPQLLLTRGENHTRKSTFILWIKPGFQKSCEILHIMKSLKQCHWKCSFRDMFKDARYLLLQSSKLKKLHQITVTFIHSLEAERSMNNNVPL